MEFLEKIALERSKDFYDDAISPSAKKAGEAIETLASLFSDVLLYPVKKANENYKYKYKLFKDELSKKTENIPHENAVDPSLIIAGPVLENLKYAFDEKHIRNMYLDLLSNAMDSSKSNLVHPSFVDVIKNLSPNDALVLKEIKRKSQIPAVKIVMQYGDRIIVDAMPSIFAPSIELGLDPFYVSLSVQNLIRLGIVNYYNVNVIYYDYNGLSEHVFVKNRIKEVQDHPSYSEKKITISTSNWLIELNDFGKAFSFICLSDN
ncbi:DUF4393 domain-containing protein [Photobacterium carnosum]|uniref:DUF4393 domain-containing protein n=1 Tax=Photobacterium carnosum TaxID=2023717 RepID=UPI001E4A2267|nr:DUF4393 domain-containing protein [Photobacterium carnosum]MCD9524783.1 DUF4393 domain-containing protein [Photobacterium carnosum]